MKRWLHLLALLAWVSVAGNLPAQVDSIHMSEMNGADHGSWHIRVPLNVIVITQIAPPANTVLGGKYWAMDSLSQSQGKLGSVADILRELPSFSMKRYAPGGLSSPTMRGTGAGHTQIFWEGLPLNSPLLGQQDFALSGGGLFNHVEARYGGNSLLQGAGGLGGAILLGSTSAANDLKPIAISFSQQVGSFGSIGSHLNLHFASKHFTSSTKVYWNSARNDFPFVNSGKLGNPVERLPNAAIQQMGVLQEFGYMWNRHQFNLKIWALHSERNLPPTMLALNTLESQSDRALRSLLTWRQYLRQAQLKTDVAYFQEQLTYRNPTAGILAPSSFGRIMAESQVMR
ncbi:MAG TPA: Plug domain-containing protein, partial [Bacteroidia bacterium]|nr:Plug domain-containing protein [Bacteroidia bacterium]